MPGEDSPASAEAQLQQAKEIAGRVKHDVNNLLMGLLGQATLLANRADLSEAARAKVRLIEEHGQGIRDRIVELDELRNLGRTRK